MNMPAAKPNTRGRRRGKQLGKAVEWLDRIGEWITIAIPGKGCFDIHRDQLEIYEAIYGRDHVIRVVDKD